MDVNGLCRKIAAEGAVLLKNEKNVLPFARGTRVAVFGRAQTFYYKSGTGSGGLVHIDEEPCILTSLRAEDGLVLDEELVKCYTDWVQEHPFNDGGGEWAGEPWFQEEMPLEDVQVKEAAARNEAAVIVFARTAGEDHDNADEEGSYRLTADEEQVLALVTAHFERVIVALNVGNVIDTSFADRYPVSAVLYLWQGGMEGANAFADLLVGKEAPAGRLTDTIAKRIEDHPSHANFGDRERNVYAEDVYVGYRYFETFRPDAVQYPFGYGLSYTAFETACTAEENGGVITVRATVTNTGCRNGKETVQVYYKAPCGLLGTPSRQLAAFAKTKSLAPRESQELTLSFAVTDMASYDDLGVTGHRSCYVLEAGDYEVFAGANVRDAVSVYHHTVPALTVVEELEEVMSLNAAFERLCAEDDGDRRRAVYCTVPCGTVDLEKRIADRRPADLPFTGDCGIRLADVYDGKHTLDAFVAQLSDDDLAALCCGEGMNSPKATPGTGGALGGQTASLSAFGIPVCCVTDGPSGVRLDSGEKASSIPNGTLLACTWDTALVEELYAHISEELAKYHVDALLGPGINIHRHPLCGRHFEYFSEDPFLTGKLAAAVTRGVAKCGAFATIKHFCCNNQETNRYGCESVVSERALREVYLKPFEIAVKEGENVLIMTAYNPVNGYWTASHYDLTATVLRGEWGFENFVMTDWWAKCNLSCGSDGNGALLQAMVRAKGDVYMVCQDAQNKAQSILGGLRDGYITRGELQDCVKRLCDWILRCGTFKEYLANGCVPKFPVVRDASGMSEAAVWLSPQAGERKEIALHKGATRLVFTLSADADVLAQMPVTVTVGDETLTFSVCGTNGAAAEIDRFIDLAEDGAYSVTVSHADVVRVSQLKIEQ